MVAAPYLEAGRAERLVGEVEGEFDGGTRTALEGGVAEVRLALGIAAATENGTPPSQPRISPYMKAGSQARWVPVPSTPSTRDSQW